MEVIPAIDIRGGRCVRLEQGDYARETVFGEDPEATALHWEQCGARRIHVVDLDGARQGRPINRGVIAAILGAVSVPVQVSGGIRDLEVADGYLKAGADRVAFGTAAVKDQTTIVNAVSRFGERVLVGVDARNGVVATEGWLEQSNLGALDLVNQLSELGVARVYYTDIMRDGLLSGPNFAAIHELVEHAAGLASPMAVIASGGVSTVEHLQRLKLIGVEGAIVGKALYTGVLEIGEALRAVSS
jgi:phosphoribosylformimino-5-aminoimidazole carboxamide ribotide isomerase